MTVEDNLCSRFILKSDTKCSNFFFPLPTSWPSRPYEYSWASTFVNSDDTVLDAACGIPHPLKFYLAEKGCDVYACDIDEKILSFEEVNRDIKCEFGDPGNFNIQLFEKVIFCQADLTKLPYENEKFDKIFCISVIEHLTDFFNKYEFLPFGLLHYVAPHNIYLALSEFKRVLKDDGLIILTFDHPRINLKYFDQCMKMIGLKYVTAVSYDISESTFYHDHDGKKLCFFRAVIRKEPFRSGQ